MKKILSMGHRCVSYLVSKLRWHMALAKSNSNSSKINVPPKPTVRIGWASGRDETRHRPDRSFRFVQLVSYRADGERRHERDGGGFSVSLAICATGFSVARHCHGNRGRLATSRRPAASRRTPPLRAIVTNRQHDDTMHLGAHAAHNLAETGRDVSAEVAEGSWTNRRWPISDKRDDISLRDSQRAAKWYLSHLGASLENSTPV